MLEVSRLTDERTDILLVEGKDVIGLQGVFTFIRTSRRLSGGEHSQCAPSQPLTQSYCRVKGFFCHSQLPQAPEELDEELDEEFCELDDELEDELKELEDELDGLEEELELLLIYLPLKGIDV